MITKEYLSQCFSYDAHSGDLIWKERPTTHFSCDRAHKAWNTRYANTNTGTEQNRGYSVVRINGKGYLKHRIIWMLTYGVWPKCIDHINGDRWDNKLENLRSVAPSENSKNLSQAVNNTSGVTGVCRNGKAFGKCWRARIKINRKDMSLGYFDSFEEAVEARKLAEIQYGFHPNHGKTYEVHS